MAVDKACLLFLYDEYRRSEGCFFPHPLYRLDVFRLGISQTRVYRLRPPSVARELLFPF